MLFKLVSVLAIVAALGLVLVSCITIGLFFVSGVLLAKASTAKASVKDYELLRAVNA